MTGAVKKANYRSWRFDEAENGSMDSVHFSPSLKRGRASDHFCRACIFNEMETERLPRRNRHIYALSVLPQTVVVAQFIQICKYIDNPSCAISRSEQDPSLPSSYVTTATKLDLKGITQLDD
jgi:hypothetical protein